ncbi:hypothetical protein B0H14DRAFT_2602496 [Mycena olivaceomarginata]|nr:hypothetical protein B0H14DRAFT_2602496 [Mycena olivaceomarginata]
MLGKTARDRRSSTVPPPRKKPPETGGPQRSYPSQKTARDQRSPMLKCIEKNCRRPPVLNKTGGLCRSSEVQKTAQDQRSSTVKSIESPVLEGNTETAEAIQPPMAYWNSRTMTPFLNPPEVGFAQPSSSRIPAYCHPDYIPTQFLWREVAADFQNRYNAMLPIMLILINYDPQWLIQFATNHRASGFKSMRTDKDKLKKSAWDVPE